MYNLLQYTNIFSFIDYQINLYNKQFNDDKEHFSISESFTSLRNLISILIYFAFVVVSAILAWRCNVEYNTTQRIIITIIAGLLGPWYLLYYSFYHTVLNKSCDHSLIKRETIVKLSESAKNTTSNLVNKVKQSTANIGGGYSDNLPIYLSHTPNY